MPFTTEQIQEEFSNKDEKIWVVKEQGTGRYVTVPHQSYHGRRLVPLFLSRHDADIFLDAVLKENIALSQFDISPVEAILSNEIEIISQSPPLGYALYSPNEVWEWARDYEI